MRPSIIRAGLMAGLLLSVAAPATAKPLSPGAHGNVCEPPSKTHAVCAAQVLINPRTGKPLTFRVSRKPARARRFAHRAADGSISYTYPAALLGSPQYLQRSYDLEALSAAQGAGDTVGIVDVDAGYTQAASDLAAYRSAFGLPACTTASGCLRITDEHGGQNLTQTAPANDRGWGFETALDLDAVSAICPNCRIVLVEAGNEDAGSLQTAEQTAAALGANQISNSWLEYWTFSESSFVFPGVATLAATGDDSYLSGDYSTPYPASFAGVTAVGGTKLIPAQTPNARGVQETASAYDSSSCSTVTRPAWQTVLTSECPGRILTDVSADGETDTGLETYYSPDGNLTGYFGGGTSLATALTAAYYGLIGRGYGIDGAAWAYSQNAAALNDITGGANTTLGAGGNCLPAAPSLCQAGPGYDGPTGAGSISGAIIPGAPGVAGGTACNCVGDPGTYLVSSSDTQATVSGGVYPNGEDTSYWWVYHPTDGGPELSTAPKDIGAGTAPVQVTDTITGLTAGATYDFQLVAANRYGTVSYSPAGFGLSLFGGSDGPQPPTVKVISGPSATSSSTTITISYQETGAVSTTYCQVDNVSVPCSATAATLSGLKLGPHRFEVIVGGPGGFASAALNFSVQAPPPPPGGGTGNGGARARVWNVTLTGNGHHRQLRFRASKPMLVSVTVGARRCTRKHKHCRWTRVAIIRRRQAHAGLNTINLSGLPVGRLRATVHLAGH